MTNTKQVISASAAEEIITSALRTAAEAYEKIASTPDSEGMRLTKQLREQFIRQAQEAEALCVQIEDGVTRINGAAFDYTVTAHAHDAHGPRQVRAYFTEGQSARTVAQVLRGCGYNVTEEVQP